MPERSSAYAYNLTGSVSISACGKSGMTDMFTPFHLVAMSVDALYCCLKRVSNIYSFIRPAYLCIKQLLNFGIQQDIASLHQLHKLCSKNLRTYFVVQSCLFHSIRKVGPHHCERTELNQPYRFNSVGDVNWPCFATQANCLRV